MNKNQIFEYILAKLVLWYMEERGFSTIEEFNNDNDFSLLKVLKLLFLVVAKSSEKDEMVLNKFQFHALPFGPVDLDIYENLKKNRQYGFSVSRNSMIYKDSVLNSISNSQTNETQILNPIIEDIISKKENKLVLYSPGDLVDITHQWTAWKIPFGIATRNNERKRLIPNFLIKDEDCKHMILYKKYGTFR